MCGFLIVVQSLGPLDPFLKQRRGHPKEEKIFLYLDNFPYIVVSCVRYNYGRSLVWTKLLHQAQRTRPNEVTPVNSTPPSVN